VRDDTREENLLFGFKHALVALTVLKSCFLYSTFLDEDKKKKTCKRKQRSNSQREPIVWKTDIEAFYNIYAELGRYVGLVVKID